MKLNAIMAVILSGLVVPSLCNAYSSNEGTSNSNNSQSQNQSMDQQGHQGQQGMGQDQQRRMDAQILAIVLAVNENEIAAASEALIKTKNPAVRAFAQLMMKEHTQNLNETLKVSRQMHINPQPSEKSRELKRNGKKELSTLKGMDGKKFDRTYIEAMVNGHTAVLQLFDNELLKNATNQDLMAHLKNTRPHVEHHLKEAQSIQQGVQ